jgi:acetolactate synthase I/II/III large subunit
MPTTAAATAKAIADAGVERVFGLPGGEILVLIDELRRAGVDFVLMRHEANAGIAAAVYGKLRGQPGVVLTTLGPGAANLMLPISSAYLDQEPLLAISAQIPTEFPSSHTHQLLPLREIYSPLCRYVDTITDRHPGEVVRRALDECMRRPFGPAYLTLSAREAPKEVTGSNVFVAEAASPPSHLRCNGEPRRSSPESRASGGGQASATSTEDPGRKATELTALLARATRPLVLVGLGIHSSNAQRIRRWVTDWNLPVAVTPKVKGIVDETAGNFVGVISGMAADGLMCEALAASDLLIGLGLDPVEVDKTWHAELPIHWLLESVNVGGRLPSGVALVDHAKLLDALEAERAPGRWPAPFQAFQDKRRRLLNDRTESAGTMWPGDIIRALSSAVPPETIVTTDVGSHKYLFGQFWPSREPETFWMSNGLSGMAYGLSAAVGAKLARPDVPVLAALGDGGFSMNSQELETAERVGAPFVTVVLEDGSYSLIKLAQEGRKLEPYRMDFGRIDTVKMAEACGVQALRTSNPDELASAVKVAVERRQSLVVGVPVNYEDYRRLF